MAKITIYGLENRMQSKGKSIFDRATMPNGYDSDTLKDSIIHKCGEFESLYSDPYFLQIEVALWFKKWNESFARWWELRHLEYNPIENYDRYEDSTVNGSTTSHSSASGESSGRDSESTQNYVSAYDSNNLSPSEQTTSNGTTNNNTSNNASTDGTSTQGTVSHIHGNIGVTTNAQMIEQEMKLAENNLYDMVADLFTKEFVLLIY